MHASLAVREFQLTILCCLSSTPPAALLAMCHRARFSVKVETLQKWNIKCASDAYLIWSSARMSAAQLQDSVDSYQYLISEAELGKPILAIGEASQILLDSGLVPGVENYKAVVKLEGNYNEQVQLQLAQNFQRNAFTHYVTPDDEWSFPLTGAKYFILPQALALEVEHQGLGVWKYLTNTEATSFAALANKNGNVLAMLPEIYANDMGLNILTSMHYYLEHSKFVPLSPLYYYPRK